MLQSGSKQSQGLLQADLKVVTANLVTTASLVVVHVLVLFYCKKIWAIVPGTGAHWFWFKNSDFGIKFLCTCV
jgi:hypothetical protein